MHLTLLIIDQDYFHVLLERDHYQYYQKLVLTKSSCLGPYHVENTGSRSITEVKQRRARLVLGRETTWEYRVL
jgi:hypothetical protein